MLAKKENKNLKVVERFRVERGFAHGSLCIEFVGGGVNDALPSVYIPANLLLAESKMYLD